MIKIYELLWPATIKASLLDFIWIAWIQDSKPAIYLNFRQRLKDFLIMTGIYALYAQGETTLNSKYKVNIWGQSSCCGSCLESNAERSGMIY